MREFSFSNKVDANKDEVFKLMLGIENYNSWNTSLHYKSGEMQVNNTLLLKASLDGKKFIDWSCHVDEVNKYSFVLSKSFVSRYYMHMKHYFIVKEIDNKTCEVIHKWEGTGISPLLFWNKIKTVMIKFKAYNESLISHFDRKE
jgi:hypothetical protein